MLVSHCFNVVVLVCSSRWWAVLTPSLRHTVRFTRSNHTKKCAPRLDRAEWNRIVAACVEYPGILSRTLTKTKQPGCSGCPSCSRRQGPSRVCQLPPVTKEPQGTSSQVPNPRRSSVPNLVTAIVINYRCFFAGVEFVSGYKVSLLPSLLYQC